MAIKLNKASFDITAKDKTKKATSSVTKGLQSVIGKLGPLAAGLGAVTGVAGFGLLISQALKAGDTLAKMSDKIGISTEALAQLNLAVSLMTPAGPNALAEALTKMQKRLGEANQGGGAALRWLKILNLNIEELVQLSPEEVFQRYSEAIRGLNTQGERLAATSALMGDESRNLINVIVAEDEALAKITNTANEFGLALSRIEAKQIENTNDSITLLQKKFNGMFLQLTTKLAPIFTTIIKILTSYVPAMGSANKATGESTDSFTGLVATIGFVGDAIDGLIRLVKVFQIAMLITGNTINLVFLEMVKQAQDAVQVITKLLNKIPGVNIELADANTQTFAERAIDIVTSQIVSLRQKMIDIFAEPIFSDLVGAEAQAAADEINKVTVPTKLPKALGLGAGIDPEQISDFDTTTKENELAESGRQKELGALQAFLQRQNVLRDNSFQDRTDRENLFYEEGEALVEERFQAGVIKDQERNLLLQDLESNHQKKLSDIADEQAKARTKTIGVGLTSAASLFNTIAGAMDKTSKSGFEKQKKLQKASVIMSTAAAIMRSYSDLGPVGGTFAAVAIAAAGIAQLVKINKQTFGSSGGGISTPNVNTGGGNISNQNIPNPLNPLNQSNLNRQPLVVNNFFGDFNGLESDEFIVNVRERLNQVTLDQDFQQGTVIA